MKVLITGGLGFIGSNLAFKMQETGHSVYILDDRSNNTVPVIEGATLIHGDVRRNSDIDKALSDRDIECIVHLAAVPGIETCAYNPLLALSVNVDGTLKLLEKAIEHGVGYFVMASSVGAVLGKQIQPALETQTPRPQSIYGWSKLMAEQLVKLHADKLATCILRFTNVYGENCQQKESIIPKLLIREPDSLFTIYGNGEQTRDFVYVGDVCNAVVAAFEKEAKGLIHIGLGKKVPLLELIETIKDATNTTLPVQFRDVRPHDLKDNYTSIQAAKELLEWEPETSLKEGIKRTWKWLKESSTDPDDERLELDKRKQEMAKVIQDMSSDG